MLRLITCLDPAGWVGEDARGERKRGSGPAGVVELRGVTGVAGEQWSCMSGVVEGDDGLRVRSEFLRGFFCKTVTRTTFPGRREYIVRMSYILTTS